MISGELVPEGTQGTIYQVHHTSQPKIDLLVINWDKPYKQKDSWLSSWFERNALRLIDSQEVSEWDSWFEVT